MLIKTYLLCFIIPLLTFHHSDNECNDRYNLTVVLSHAVPKQHKYNVARFASIKLLKQAFESSAKVTVLTN